MLVAGGLSVVNPCGFPLLPAFLSFYFGAEEEQLPPASTRVAQGLVVGGLVALGFLGFFALVGLLVSFGVGAIARAVPWAGPATGALLAIVGLGTLLGTYVRLPLHLRLPKRSIPTARWRLCKSNRKKKSRFAGLLQRERVTDLVVELGESRSAPIRDALRRPDAGDRLPARGR